MGRNKVLLDFHVYDIHQGERFFLIGQPIEPLVNPNQDRAVLQFKVGKEIVPVSLTRAVNTISEATPEKDPVEEVVSSTHEELARSDSAEDESQYIQEEQPDDFVELKEEERPQHPLPELKQLPPGLK